MQYRFVIALSTAALSLSGCAVLFPPVNGKQTAQQEKYSEKGSISGERMEGWQKKPAKTDSKTAGKSRARAALRAKKPAAAAFSQPAAIKSSQTSAPASKTPTAGQTMPADPVSVQKTPQASTQQPASSLKTQPASTTVPASETQPPLRPQPQPAQTPQPEKSTAAASAAPPSGGTRTATSFLVQKANQELKTGNLDAAAAYLENALSLNPDNAAIRFDIANIRYHQGQYAAAEKQAHLAIQAGGSASTAKKSWVLIANTRKILGDSQGAIQAAEQAASLSESAYRY